MLKFFFVTLTMALCLSTASATESNPETTQKMREEINQSLDKIETQIGRLEVKSKTLSAKAQAEWQSTLSDLKKHRDELKSSLAQEKEQTTSKAKEYWTRIKAAATELQKGVAAASEKIKGQKNE